MKVVGVLLVSSLMVSLPQLKEVSLDKLGTRSSVHVVVDNRGVEEVTAELEDQIIHTRAVTTL